MIERDIDCRKHRKSTHLASADLDAMTLESKSLIFTIEDVWYETKVDVSGNVTDGYFCKLKDVKKHLVLNSTNRLTLSGFAKLNGHINEAAYNIGNWKGLKIELFVDRNVKMMGKTTDGIRIKPIQPKEKVKETLTDEGFIFLTSEKATKDQIKTALESRVMTELQTKKLKEIQDGTAK